MSSWEELTYKVAQAQGMISAQASCTVSEAIVMMNDRVQVQHQTLADIAGVLSNGASGSGPDPIRT